MEKGCVRSFYKGLSLSGLLTHLILSSQASASRLYTESVSRGYIKIFYLCRGLALPWLLLIMCAALIGMNENSLCNKKGLFLATLVRSLQL